jgi:hypothetical protein
MRMNPIALAIGFLIGSMVVSVADSVDLSGPDPTYVVMRVSHNYADTELSRHDSERAALRKIEGHIANYRSSFTTPSSPREDYYVRVVYSTR